MPSTIRHLVAALLVFTLGALSAVTATAADFAKNYGGAGVTAQANGSALDSSGNSYLAGFFNTANFTNPAMTRIGTQDGFVIKSDPAGVPVWAKNFSGAGATLQLAAVAVSAAGNVYATGFFQTADLTSPALTRIGTKDAVLIKLDSAGNLIWARNYGGAGVTTQGLGVTVDGAENVYLTGFFNAASMTIPALTKIGSQDAFIIKLDSTGTVTWARNYGGAGAMVQSNNVKVDGAGNVYLAATLNAASMTTPAMTRFGGRDMVLFKIDSSGAITWTRHFGGAGANANGIAVALDGTGNVILYGHFFGADLTTPPVTKIGSTDGVAVKLDSAGTMLWAKNVGGTAGAVNVTAVTLAADSAGNAYLGGYFQSGNLTTPPLSLIGADDAYLIKLDSASGAAVWGRNFATSSTISFSTGVNVDGIGTLYMGGYFFGSTIQVGATLLTKIGTTDAMLVKQSTTPDAPVTVTAVAGITQATVSFSAPVITGGAAITSYTVTANPGPVTATGPASGIVVTGLASGTPYTFTVTATNPEGTSLPSVASNAVTPTAPQTISFANPGAQTFGTSPTITATASSTLAVTFTSSTPAVCTITSGGVLTFVAAGNCTIDADQAGDGTFGPAPQVSNTFVVDPAAQAILFGALGAQTFGAAPFAVSATGGLSGNPVTFTSTTPAVCTTGSANGATVTLIATGTCTIAADQAASANYTAAPQVTQSFAVAPGAQAIAFGALGARAFGTAPFSVSATGGASGNPVTFSSLTTAVCTSAGINGATITLVAAGTCTIAADQAGNANYTAAARVNQSFSVDATSQAIAFAALAGRTFGAAPFVVSATGGPSGNPVTFTSTTPAVCTASGTNGATVTLIAAGSCTIAADQAGNANYNAAPQVTRSFTVSLASQLITFAALSGRQLGSGSFTVSATGGASGNPVTFTSTTPAVCTSGGANGATVTLVATGTCTIAANQAGNANYSAALQVTQGFAVSASAVVAFSGASPTGTGNITAALTGGGSACSFTSSQLIGAPPGSPPIPPTAPPGAIVFLHGLFDFTLTGCTAGSTVTFTMTYPAALPAGTAYWKYGPTPGDPTQHWYVLPATISGATATFSITDGGLGDDDLLANGTIVDQGGPGVPGSSGAIPTPTLSQWALILLSLMLLGFAAPALRRGTQR